MPLSADEVHRVRQIDLKETSKARGFICKCCEVVLSLPLKVCITIHIILAQLSLAPLPLKYCLKTPLPNRAKTRTEEHDACLGQNNFSGPPPPTQIEVKNTAGFNIQLILNAF